MRYSFMLYPLLAVSSASRILDLDGVSSHLARRSHNYLAARNYEFSIYRRADSPKSQSGSRGASPRGPISPESVASATSPRARGSPAARRANFQVPGSNEHTPSPERRRTGFEEARRSEFGPQHAYAMQRAHGGSGGLSTGHQHPAANSSPRKQPAQAMSTVETIQGPGSQHAQAMSISETIRGPGSQHAQAVSPAKTFLSAGGVSTARSPPDLIAPPERLDSM